MNLAIIIGVSSYENLRDLPGCDNDVAMMSKILKATGKYSDIFEMSGEVTAKSLKDKMEAWIEHHKAQLEPVEEIFFYYTGHGGYKGDAYFFCQSDYQTDIPNKTGVSNELLDDWLRSLDPYLTIKFVDACESEVAYIKDVDERRKTEIYLSKTATHFRHCIFFFSSQANQSSYLGDEYSEFTQVFIDYVIDRAKDPKSDIIKYREIREEIADAFLDNPEQRPVFATHELNTEEFCRISSEMRETLIAISSNSSVATDEKDIIPIAVPTLVELIAKASNKIASEEDVLSLLKQIHSQFESVEFSQTFQDIFVVSKTDYFSRTNNPLPDQDVIGRWLYDTTGKFFARPTKENDIKSASASIQLGILTRSMVDILRDYKSPRDLVNGYSVTVDLPFDILVLETTSRFKAPPKYKLSMQLLFTRESIFIFSAHTREDQVGWGAFSAPSTVKWTYGQYLILNSESILGYLSRRYKEFEGFVLDNLADEFKDMSDNA